MKNKVMTDSQVKKSMKKLRTLVGGMLGVGLCRECIVKIAEQNPRISKKYLNNYPFLVKLKKD